ncbi:serine/threonine-protein kinase [Nocardia aurantiaca]|uniref:serine/threonine-protein kinase n=1 Tax=Nocardia aurantiaca TaxID=2675850 RepID=UPI002286E8F8|nr:serine/threonine protein kinase [Nocardia aurantiaca]
MYVTGRGSWTVLNSGDVFAGFTVERLLGQGGMGSVYLARHPRLGKLTALKLLNRELYADREIRARFEREADLVARLDHPNIVEVYDRGTEDEMLWISMQYVDGVDAASVNVATLPPERAVQVIEGVASALDYAHGMGVLHRDVKPANIILARAVGGHGERVFLTDFGIARLREDSTHLTQAGMFTATLAYASPEQMTGAHLDPTTDQYSLACALYWLLIGAGPYDSPHPAELIRGHLQLLPPPVSLRRPGLSPAMDAVLTKAMAKRPADRFPTCTEFAKSARRALSGPPAQHPVHQQAIRPAYPNPPAAQPNYQPYPAPPPGYPAVPPGYPASAAPPNQPAYPVPPQPVGQPLAAGPNYPAPQSQPVAPGYPPPQQPAAPFGYPAPRHDADGPGSGPTARPYPPGQDGTSAVYSASSQPPPAGASGYPAQQSIPNPDQVGSGPTVRPYPPSQDVAPVAYSPPLQPQPADASGYPVPQSAAAVPQPSQQPAQDSGDIGSGPTIRPEPCTGTPNYPVPQPSSMPPDTAVRAPAATARPPLPPATPVQSADPSGQAADEMGSGATHRSRDVVSHGAAEDASRRPTDVVPQPVVSAGLAEGSSSAGPAEVRSWHSGSGAGRQEVTRSIAAEEDSSSQAVGESPQPPVPGGTGETDLSEPVLGRVAGPPGFGEIIAEPEAVPAQPVAALSVSSTAPDSSAESTAVAAEEESGCAAEMWARGPVSARDAAASVDPESGVAAVAADSEGAEGESDMVARHPDSGAFVPECAVEASPESAAVTEASQPVVSEPVSGLSVDVPGSGPARGMPGYAGYGGEVPGAPGYGGPPFGGNPVRPGLIPTSQRAEASQLTAMVVLGLAVVALVLVVVIAVVVVSG